MAARLGNLGGIKNEAVAVVVDWWVDKNGIFFFSFQREKGGERGSWAMFRL